MSGVGGTPSLFDRLMHVQAGRCFYCECTLTTANPDDPTFATFDHIKPRSAGGKNNRNRILACRCCNNRRGSTALDDVTKTRAIQVSRSAYKLHRLAV